jgi:ferredoxin
VKCDVLRDKEPVTVTFKFPNGNKIPIKAKEGDTLLDVVVNNNIDIDGFGACEGTLSCSTCHVILDQKDFDRIKEKPTDEELDMLDLAYGLTDTSRLGCQIYLTKDLDGLEVQVPEGINDVRAEG